MMLLQDIQYHLPGHELNWSDQWNLSSNATDTSGRKKSCSMVNTTPASETFKTELLLVKKSNKKTHNQQIWQCSEKKFVQEEKIVSSCRQDMVSISLVVLLSSQEPLNCLLEPDKESIV